MFSATQPKTEESVKYLPPLETGDRLTRPEFHRRYKAMPQLKKAELIEGVVYMPSPVSANHSTAHAHLLVALGIYVAATPGSAIDDNATVFLDVDNEVQPDILLRLLNGSVRINDNHYFEGAPELIAEIAASSASYDLHDKMHVYRRNGVREYLVWQVYDARIDWFHLHEGRYEALPASDAGILRSRFFPGLHLNAGALLQGDLAAVVATVQSGVQTPEHAAFVEQIRTSSK